MTMLRFPNTTRFPLKAAKAVIVSVPGHTFSSSRLPVSTPVQSSPLSRAEYLRVCPLESEAQRRPNAPSTQFPEGEEATAVKFPEVDLMRELPCWIPYTASVKLVKFQLP